jgi:chromate reductase
MVPLAQDKVDSNGKVTDEKTRKKIRELLQSLAAWTRRMKLGEEALAMTKPSV